MKTVPHHGDIFRLCDIVRETSFEIHKYLRSGYIEKVYENALAHRLRKNGIAVRQKHPLTVLDEDGAVIGRLEVEQNGLVVFKNWSAIFVTFAPFCG